MFFFMRKTRRIGEFGRKNIFKIMNIFLREKLFLFNLYIF